METASNIITNMHGIDGKEGARKLPKGNDQSIQSLVRDKSIPTSAIHLVLGNYAGDVNYEKIHIKKGGI